MGAVSQLDENDADILHHRHNHLAEVLCLRFFLVTEFQLIQLRNAFDQLRHAFTKQLFHVLVSGRCIFDHVMQQRGHEGFMVELHFRQNTGYGNRMGDIRLTAGACLSLVGITCDKVGLLEALDLLLWQVFFNQLIETFKQIQGRPAGGC